jgi:hypothetical protein
MAASNSISSRAASNRRQLAGVDNYVPSPGAANKFCTLTNNANTNLVQNSSRRHIFGRAYLPHFDIVLRELILEQQACSYCILVASMR